MRTVIVEGVPNALRTTSTLATYFEALYPNAIAHVQVYQDLSLLDDLVRKREACLAQLERCLAIAERTGTRPVIRVPGISHSTYNAK
jgi:predicted RNase H-like nuclease